MFAAGKFGFLFPGQGAQYVGMGKDLAEAFPAARIFFDRADQILGYSIQKLCFEGPEDELRRTLYAQPAIFVVSMAALEVLREKFGDLCPSFSAGLSLGEFSALVAAKAMAFEETLSLVKIRAEAMEEAAKKFPGTMASIIGLSQQECEELAGEAGCQVANLNSPDQIALSGTFESIEKACRLAVSRGAQRAVPLQVGGAFHSPLMEEAKDRLENALREVAIQTPACLFVPNAAACETKDPEVIRGLLAKQLMSPVRWVETMSRAAQLGISRFVEVGPGKVLKGLARKCRPDFQVYSCGEVRDLAKLGSMLKPSGT